jgi:deoxyribodipyrimidine photo-lyase
MRLRQNERAMTVAIHWFRRDLRLRDNPALFAAQGSSKRLYGAYWLGEMDALNERQRTFVIGCLKQLRLALDRRDASLTLLEGPIEEALPAMASRLGATAVHAARVYSGRELEIEKAAQSALSSSGVELHLHRGHAVHEPEAVAGLKAPGRTPGYRVFPPFYDVWKSLPLDASVPESACNAQDPSPGPLPAAPVPLHAPTSGEEAAQAQLQKFVTARLADYAVNSEYPARNGASGLAVYLRFGCLSPRTVHRAVVERMSRSWTLAQERLSMEAFFRRIALRDFFLHLAFYEPTLHEAPLQEKMRAFEWSTDPDRLQAWIEGKTGYPFIDAAMRQLRREGHVHQRAAIAATSFCCFDLGLDWRLGRDVWMRGLLEADEALCDGNWQWIAGVGSDQAAYPRIYNPEKQARHFDAQATYVRRYCPELSRLPTRAALAPWQMERNQQIELGFYSPDHYPQPIVDHDEVAREFLARYQAYLEKTSAGV